MKTDAKVIDTALKYGYESPESFTRAFTRFHGVTPTEAKREGGRLRSFSRFKVQIILKGGNSMNYIRDTISLWTMKVPYTYPATVHWLPF